MKTFKNILDFQKEFNTEEKCRELFRSTTLERYTRLPLLWFFERLPFQQWQDIQVPAKGLP